MNKHDNMDFMSFVDEITERFGDTPVEITFRDVKEGIDSFFGMVCLTSELVSLIRKESELKKHHRAYLHVRDEIEECADEAMEFIADFMDTLSEREHIFTVEDFPFAEAEDDETGVVTLSRKDYDKMIEDILTLGELVTMVTEMRTGDLNAIHELGKYIPSFAAFERKRLSVYKDARFEADEIIDRLEDMDEPYEYFSD